MNKTIKNVLAHMLLLLGLGFMIMATAEFGGQPTFLAYFFPSGMCFLIGLEWFIECVMDG